MTQDLYSRVKKKELKLKGIGSLKKSRKPAAEEEEEDSPERNNSLDGGVGQEVSPNRDDGGEKTAEAESKSASADLDSLQKEIEKLAVNPNLTRAEKTYKLAQLKKRKQAIQDKLRLSHKERIAKLNKHLSSLGEHFDIPKVGPG